MCTVCGRIFVKNCVWNNWKKKHTVQKRRQRSLLNFGGRNSFNYMPQDEIKKGMTRRTDAWQNGCFRKMVDHLVRTPPNHHPPKMDFNSKTFLQIILAVKYIASAAFNYVPQRAKTTFAFSSVWNTWGLGRRRQLSVVHCLGEVGRGGGGRPISGENNQVSNIQHTLQISQQQRN